MKDFGLKNFEQYSRYHETLIRKNTSIYHYTDINAFESILKTGSFWATKCQHFLKDKDETKHSLDILDKISEQKGMKAILDNATKKTFLDKWERETKKTYLVSFSKSKKSKSLLEACGEKCVIIELDTTAIDKKFIGSGLDIFDKNNNPDNIHAYNFFNEVIYGNLEITKYIRKLYDKFYNEYQNDINIENRHDRFPQLFQLALLYKDVKYYPENEIRIVFTLIVNDTEKVENFRIIDDKKIPYMNISFKTDGKLPIKSVKVKSDLISKVEHILKENGYDTPVLELAIKTIT